MRVFLLVDDFSHIFHLLNGRCRCLKPLDVRVLSEVHVIRANLVLGFRLHLALLKLAHVFLQEGKLSLDLLTLLLQKIDIKRINLILEWLGRLEADRVFDLRLTFLALTSERKAINACLDHLVRLQKMAI